MSLCHVADTANLKHVNQSTFMGHFAQCSPKHSSIGCGSPSNQMCCFFNLKWLVSDIYTDNFLFLNFETNKLSKFFDCYKFLDIGSNKNSKNVIFI